MSQNLALATLAGGCFWCLEAVFIRIQGVLTVQSGYTGGHDPHPSYTAVCRGETGHAEAVHIQFDPEQVSYQALLAVFFSIHDPTTHHRQGHDVGSQYRSAIFTHTPEQRLSAEQYLQQLAQAKLFAQPIVTEIQDFSGFYPAEIEHHRYYEQHPQAPYCLAVVAPKVRKLQQNHPHMPKYNIKNN